MLQQKLTICNKLGLHARAAAKLAKTCGRFASKITVSNGHSTVDGKSVMSLMLLAAGIGTPLSISCEGSDEAEAINAIADLVLDRFGEGE